MGEGSGEGYAFSGAAVDRLCHASGGYLRDLMTLMQDTCMEAMAVHPDLPLTEADVGAAIRNLGAQRRDVVGGYRDVLCQIAQTHSLEGLPGVRSTLLWHRLVYEYFGNEGYWYDIPPLVA